MCCSAFKSGKIGGPWMTKPQVLLPTLLPWIKSPGAPYHMDRLQFLLFLKAGFGFLPNCRITQTSQSHSVLDTKRHFHLLILQSLTHIVPDCCVHSVPEDNPVWLHDLQCPLPLNCEHLWLINFCCLHLPSVGYYVFTNPHNPLTGLSPSLVRSRGGD